MAQQTEHLGMNRTGIQMSPLDSKAMLEDDGSLRGEAGSEAALVDLRSAYIADAEGLGSIPCPAP